MSVYLYQNAYRLRNKPEEGTITCPVADTDIACTKFTLKSHPLPLFCGFIFLFSTRTISRSSKLYHIGALDCITNHSMSCQTQKETINLVCPFPVKSKEYQTFSSKCFLRPIFHTGARCVVCL